MSRQVAEEEALLAVVVALALAQGKNADELGVLSAIVVVVGDILALLSVVLAVGEAEAEEAKAKEAGESLEARLKRIEEQLQTLAACCEGAGQK